VLFDDTGDRSPFEYVRTAREVEQHPDCALFVKAPNHMFRKRGG
jgi:hypothetical protein